MSGNRYLSPNVKIAAMVGVLLFVALATSCQELPSYEALLPDDLYPPLRKVFAQHADFAQRADGPLADVRAGTVLDDLGGVTGCWGAFVPDVAATDGVSLPVDLCHVLVFDNSRFTWWALQDAGGLFPMVMSYAGPFTIRQDRFIELHAEDVRVYNPLTQEFESPDPEPGAGQTVLTMKYRATLLENDLKLELVDDTGESELVAEAVEYRRMECP